MFHLFFRSLSLAFTEIKNASDLSLYCDILEMNTQIIQFLSKIIRISGSCLDILVQSKDCLTFLIKFLKESIYCKQR